MLNLWVSKFKKQWDFRTSWKRSLVELNGKFDPNYRHYLSRLIIQSYSEVSASLCIFFFFLNFFLLLIILIRLFTVIGLLNSESFCGNYKKGWSISSQISCEWRAMSDPCMNSFMCLFIYLLRNELELIFGGLLRQCLVDRVIGLWTLDWITTQVQS